MVSWIMLAKASFALLFRFYLGRSQVKLPTKFAIQKEDLMSIYAEVQSPEECIANHCDNLYKLLKEVKLEL